MNKIILTVAVAGLSAFGLISAANADGRDPAERAAYNETVRGSAVQLSAPVVVEGRNAAVAATVEPYIAQSVEQNARSGR